MWPPVREHETSRHQRRRHKVSSSFILNMFDVFLLDVKGFFAGVHLQWSVLLLESLVKDSCYSEPQTFFIFKNQGPFQLSRTGDTSDHRQLELRQFHLSESGQFTICREIDSYIIWNHGQFRLSGPRPTPSFSSMDSSIFRTQWY